MRIGFGYDVHKLGINQELVLGGIKIPFEKGLIGHSDADVLIHSIIDALLGSLALGDIGTVFPDYDNRFKNIDSKILLDKVWKLISLKGYKIGNLDSTIVAEKPILKNYIMKMREQIAKLLFCNIEEISIKATTNEKLGYLGKNEGIAVYCVVLLINNKIDNNKKYT